MAFDSLYYMLSNEDLLDLSIEPLTHYENYGKFEGRKASPDDVESFNRTHVAIGYRRILFDPDWYVKKYPDVQSDPMAHYDQFGELEDRWPCEHFDPVWYRNRYSDVKSSGLAPFAHYLLYGMEEARATSSTFDAPFYISQNRESANSPLLHYALFGKSSGLPTLPKVELTDILPNTTPDGLAFTRQKPVTVIIPIYKGLEETKRCLSSLSHDSEWGTYRVLIIDDCSPHRDLSDLVDRLALQHDFVVHRNDSNIGFVRSVNLGMKLSLTDDVILLNSDTEVPSRWVTRLQRQAYQSGKIASVSPISNNATICSYPVIGTNDFPFKSNMQAIDAAAESANFLKFVDAPTVVGFCMYIKREALEDIGYFDDVTFGKGYGEEVDFCQRAISRGFVNRIAWDIYVYHVGEVSFGAASPSRLAGEAKISELYQNYLRDIRIFIYSDSALPYRLALTLRIFATNGKKTTLIVTHNLGGGVERHIDTMALALSDDVNFVGLQIQDEKFKISFPLERSHPAVYIEVSRFDFLIEILRLANISHIDVHHTIGLSRHLSLLLLSLRPVPYDVVVHDYFFICPNITLTQWDGDIYCGEPSRNTCNHCVAHRHRSQVSDIDLWRLSNASILYGANRVVFPSNDAADRVSRYFNLSNGVVVPHDDLSDRKSVYLPVLGEGKPLKVAVIGVLASHKGLSLVQDVTSRFSKTEVYFKLIGYIDREVDVSKINIEIGGKYHVSELQQKILDFDPHLIWFAARWPETYSYTLSEAFLAKRAVFVPNIGAFVERIAGRPLSWRFDVGSSASEIATQLRSIRSDIAALAASRSYQVSAQAVGIPPLPMMGKIRSVKRRKLLIIPELFSHGVPTPCGYIRQILPIASVAEDLDLQAAVSTEASIGSMEPNVIFLQRHALTSMEMCKAVLQWSVDKGTKIFYDLDDDLISSESDHPDFKHIQANADCVKFWLEHAHRVFVSTSTLQSKVNKFRNYAEIVPNSIDNKIWEIEGERPRAPSDHVKILYMGTSTHTEDLKIVEQVLHNIMERHGERVRVDIIGVTAGVLPTGCRRLVPDGRLAQSYPGFVNWLLDGKSWDIGIAPLASSSFNSSKSGIKSLDYAALNLSMIASDVPAYRKSLADGVGGMLCENDPDQWFDKIDTLIRNPQQRSSLQSAGFRELSRGYTLQANGSFYKRIFTVDP